MKARYLLSVCMAGLLAFTLADCGARTESAGDTATPTSAAGSAALEAEQLIGSEQEPAQVRSTPDWDAVLPQYYLVPDETQAEIAGTRGGFCWPAQGAAGEPVLYCTNIIPPSFESSVVLPAGEPIHIRLEEPLPDQLTLSLQRGELQMVYEQISIQPQETHLRWQYHVEPGDYVLVAYARWSATGADIAFYWPVTLPAVEGGPEATPTP